MSAHNDRPTLRQLEYLVAVAEERSFSRAAERCHVSQPTLSSQIRQLELRVGREAFERTSRGVIVTPIGSELVEHARATLAAVDGFLVAANAIPRPLTGSIKLGSVSTVTPYLMPEVLAELESDYPDLRIALLDDVGEGLKRKLLEGEIDAMLTPLPAGLAGCDELELVRDPFVLLACAGSVLGEMAEPIELDCLRAARLLILDDPHCIRGQALEVCMQANSAPNSTLHATSITAVVQLVRQGLGATLLPTLAIDLELRGHSDLRVKRFVDPEPGRRLGLVWRSESPRAGDFRLLGALLMKHAIAKTQVHPPLHSVPTESTGP